VKHALATLVTFADAEGHMKKGDFDTAERKSEMTRTNKSKVGSAVLVEVEESNGELTENCSDTDPPSSKSG
jgi:hypothetical protein